MESQRIALLRLLICTLTTDVTEGSTPVYMHQDASAPWLAYTDLFGTGQLSPRGVAFWDSQFARSSKGPPRQRLHQGSLQKTEWVVGELAFPVAHYSAQFQLRLTVQMTVLMQSNQYV